MSMCKILSGDGPVSHRPSFFNSRKMAKQVLQEKATKMAIPEFIKDAGYVVQVTHVVHPGHFYARLVDLATIEDKFNDLPLEQFERPTSIRINDLVFYLSKRRDELLRGRVTDLGTNDTFHMLAIDHGFEEKDISKDFIWKCDYTFEPLAFPCALANVKPIYPAREWNVRAKYAMKGIMGSSLSLMTYKGKAPNGRLLVNLFNYDGDVGIFMILCKVAMPDHDHTNKTYDPELM